MLLSERCSLEQRYTCILHVHSFLEGDWHIRFTYQRKSHFLRMYISAKIRSDGTLRLPEIFNSAFWRIKSLVWTGGLSRLAWASENILQCLWFKVKSTSTSILAHQRRRVRQMEALSAQLARELIKQALALLESLAIILFQLHDFLKVVQLFWIVLPCEALLTHDCHG